MRGIDKVNFEVTELGVHFDPRRREDYAPSKCPVAPGNLPEVRKIPCLLITKFPSLINFLNQHQFAASIKHRPGSVQSGAQLDHNVIGVAIK